MSTPLDIDSEYLKTFLLGLLDTPSPTGFAEKAVALVEAELAQYPVALRRTAKGALVAEWEGASASAPRAVTGHVDTLGAMVKEIQRNGRLRLSKLGGFAWNTVEGEGVTVFNADGRPMRGSLLFEHASGHVWGQEVNEGKRADDSMEVRLDEEVRSNFDVERLG